MRSDDKKAAVAQYRERKVECGIYAVRCVPTGSVWVGSAPDLSTIRNRIWFSLEHKSHPIPSLREAAVAHTPDDFSFEVVERFDAEELGIAVTRTLRDSLQLWKDELCAVRI